MTWLWLTLACICLILALWPFGFYQLSLMAAARLHKFPGLPAKSKIAGSLNETKETFAICMCAYNEASCIEAKIENLLSLRAQAGHLDILVYVDGAQDGTVEILSKYKDTIELFISEERHGKTHGMNLLVRASKASVLMFTDANVMIDHGAIDVLQRYFTDPEIGCVCGNLVYVNAESSATADVGSAYWGFNEWSKGLETATGSVIGADGALFAIRRSLHNQVPDGLIDDIAVSFDILFQGKRVVRAQELKVFETHTTQAEDEFRRKIRIACECMHVHSHSWPMWRQQNSWNLYKYVGHRLLRWLGGYLLILNAIFTFLALVSVIGFSPTVAIYVAAISLMAVAIKFEWSPAMKIWNAGLAFAGTSIGVFQAWRGKRAITWNLANSARDTIATESSASH